MSGLDRGVVTVTIMQLNARKCAQSAIRRKRKCQADYAQVAVNKLAQANASGFFALVGLGNLLSRAAGVIYALAEIRRRRGKIGEVIEEVTGIGGSSVREV